MEKYLKDLKSEIDRSEILPILIDYQEKFGFLNYDFISALSERANLPAGNIYGIASFYPQFNFSPKAKYNIKLCSGISCHLKNIKELKAEIFKHTKLNSNGFSSDGKYSFEFVNCLGACAQGPVMKINDKHYINLTKMDIIKIFHELE
ncbi:MAG: NADH-quinone oxidoreductase subunit NuoE [Bacteroidales bacterium]|jgi:NADH:ubiquinone oxidoreductase subunit E|nr:NAD(P)H-dependent oxidoreductase subunit E [Bacteroidales bacterium]MCK9499968.1 NAD(P)H-dependent oxidoreductase subunit E [Bacteroidales bacterium]MDY0314867.1 NAD(P)H-dependent oxidoreductase subunit E [Bacteroidales bacterium]NLB86390.1 NADH-quinone oxidoreductase subunit NuoE [Bacteroidales bacterium]